MSNPRLFPPRLAAISGVSFALSCVLTACIDSDTPVQPDEPRAIQLAEEPDEGLSVTLPVGGPSEVPGPAWTIRDEFAAMAKRVPGGFGGLFFDGDGVLNVVLRDLHQADAARAALDAEPFIQARRVGLRAHEFDPGQARIHSGLRDYAELYDWYRALMDEVPTTPRMGSINVERNRLFIGVADEEERALVRNAAVRVGLPPDAIRVEVVPPVRTLSVRSRQRPVPGGVQIQFKIGGQNPDCTIGPNVIRLEQTGFLVNSHCTRHPWDVDWGDITHYWQHKVNSWYEPQTTRHIGNEAIDPLPFPCSTNPENGCRNSDAALGLYNSNEGGSGNAEPDFGRVAKPLSRNTGALTLDPENPRFLLVQKMGWSLGGEVLEKVGRSTGWTGGPVVVQWGTEQEDGGCVDLTPAATQFNPNPPTLLCQMIVRGPDQPPFAAGVGDSGSPVFRMVDGLTVELRGLLWGGLPPCGPNAEGILVCDFFVASNLGGVEMDLDPWFDAPLEYFSSGSGGGGGGDPPPPGDPCDPECLH